MTIYFEAYGNPSAALFRCLICGAIVPLKLGEIGEGSLAVHREKHSNIALIKGEGENK